MDPVGTSGVFSLKAALRLCERLKLSAAQTEALFHAMQTGGAARRALILSPKATAKNYQPSFPCEPRERFSWLPEKVLLPEAGVNPVQYADYEAGMYYVLDLSSCWEGAALSAVPRAPERSLDLCAAPGGKTMLLAARFPLQNHTANEVQARRRGILRGNLLRCGVEHTQVTGFRPDQWAEQGEQFDLLLVDAPCSGQSLLCKGISNPGCLGSAAVNGNAKRQRGIMLQAVSCVRPGGHILYTTCTYDPEENERVISYLLRRFSDWRAEDVPLLAAFRSDLCDFPAYRLFPHHGCGAGGFCCLLRRLP